jgi:hypothetical protein
MRTDGNTSLTIIVLLLILSVIFLSAALFSREIIGFLFNTNAGYDDRAALRKEAERLIGIMCEDATPEADSPLDQIWSELKLASTNELSITLEDVSSRINPNSAFDYLLNISNIFMPGQNYGVLHKFRTENGLQNNISTAYAEFFSKDALRFYCSEYTFFNINTSNESMLYLLFEQRSGKKAETTTFPNQLRSMRTNKKLITEATIRDVLGPDFDTVYPFIGCKPDLNVNLVKKNILNAVINMVKNTFKVELKDGLIDAILLIREKTEIQDKQLSELIQPKFKNTILESYLGCKTWFWRLIIKKPALAYQCIIMRIPSLPGEKETSSRLRIVDETYFIPTEDAAKTEEAPIGD